MIHVHKPTHIALAVALLAFLLATGTLTSITIILWLAYVCAIAASD